MRVAALAGLLLSGAPYAAESPTIEYAATLTDLYTEAEATSLSRTLAADRLVRFRLRVPRAPTAPSGVLVFVSPLATGEMPAGWETLLDDRNLVWVAAEDFGNTRPTAQRTLAALMAAKVAQANARVDARRIFIAGMSGGGRVASQTITRFPQIFTGAIYIVGADFSLPKEPLRTLAVSRRYVFITGDKDFNQKEMRAVHARYRAAGVGHVLLIDRAGFRHENPTAAELAPALDFLDSR